MLGGSRLAGIVSDIISGMPDITNPKVFISYSWSSEEHKERVLKWAQDLVGHGIKVLIDRWSLKEGQDKYAFMESMVTDQEVNHVLCFSDATYAEKAVNVYWLADEASFTPKAPARLIPLGRESNDHIRVHISRPMGHDSSIKRWWPLYGPD
jgi:TIR domain